MERIGPRCTFFPWRLRLRYDDESDERDCLIVPYKSTTTATATPAPYKKYQKREAHPEPYHHKPTTTTTTTPEPYKKYQKREALPEPNPYKPTTTTTATPALVSQGIKESGKPVSSQRTSFESGTPSSVK